MDNFSPTELVGKFSPVEIILGKVFPTQKSVGKYSQNLGKHTALKWTVLCWFCESRAQSFRGVNLSRISFQRNNLWTVPKLSIICLVLSISALSLFQGVLFFWVKYFCEISIFQIKTFFKKNQFLKNTLLLWFENV